MFRFLRLLVLLAITGSMASTVHAELRPGSVAPDFTAEAAIAGKLFNFNLAEALQQGPVVLYFFPAAFTSGCTLEAHNFAESINKFKELNATVIGISTDDIETLKKFSVSECRSKFAVGADPDARITRRYDAELVWKSGWASRTSYVITPDGVVLYSYRAMSPDKHVDNALQALRNWSATRRR